MNIRNQNWSTKKVVKTFLGVLALALPVGLAQGFYLGGTVGTPLSATSSTGPSTDSFELGAQVGFDPFPAFGVRVGAEGNPFDGELKILSGDALFRFFLPLSATSLYAGGGIDALFSTPVTLSSSLEGADLIAHALGGLEFRLGSFGVFGEVLPSYFVGNDFSDSSSYYVRLRGGVNFHFF